LAKPNGSRQRFHKKKAGLYYLDTARPETTVEEGTALMVTVADKCSNYPACRDYSQALLACKLQGMIGYPSIKDFLWIMEHNLIPNCPIGRSNILAAKDILGPNVHSLKGKTVRRNGDH
jgi:hypothetical protein